MIPVRNAALLLLGLAIGPTVVGCTTNTSNGPFGAAADSPLLSPFAGQWVFDFDKTLASQKAAGATDEQIAQVRKLYGGGSPLGKMHPDLAIQGDVAVGAGKPSCEYRFFAMHRHDAKICGKAWHHEDRFDPGDMSKCYVRLSLVGGELHLEVNMLEALPDLQDPDLRSSPAVEGDASKCEASAQKATGWVTYVFTRRR